MNKNGVITNDSGQYTINVKKAAVLVFSSVGYDRKEVAVGNHFDTHVFQLFG